MFADCVGLCFHLAGTEKSGIFTAASNLAAYHPTLVSLAHMDTDRDSVHLLVKNPSNCSGCDLYYFPFCFSEDAECWFAVNKVTNREQLF